MENSATATDYLNAETDEVDGFVFKAKEEMYRELRKFDLMKDAREQYEIWKADYKKFNLSERVQYNRYYYNINLYRRRF
ncbi:MAG TPA: hypothetical protein ENI13_00975 [candidate division CPR3 bacterium]|uniref:Uncharacterized protein n=1 Tax=candidate division CPR3 bacterium TaxID=2268181 RepID=A0A7C1SNV0_UNCC3|nr:hypothetical protein [candidate division CPR3 bacterium]